MPCGAMSITNDVIQDITPVQQSMQDRPCDRPPINIGNNSCKHHTEQDRSFGIIRKRKLEPPPGPAAFDFPGCVLVFFSINQALDGNPEIFRDLGQGLDIRLGFARFPNLKILVMYECLCLIA